MITGKAFFKNHFIDIALTMSHFKKWKNRFACMSRSQVHLFPREITTSIWHLNSNSSLKRKRCQTLEKITACPLRATHTDLCHAHTPTAHTGKLNTEDARHCTANPNQTQKCVPLRSNLNYTKVSFLNMVNTITRLHLKRYWDIWASFCTF